LKRWVPFSEFRNSSKLFIAKIDTFTPRSRLLKYLSIASLVVIKECSNGAQRILVAPTRSLNEKEHVSVTARSVRIALDLDDKRGSTSHE
jgi:hypothetical protein